MRGQLYTPVVFVEALFSFDHMRSGVDRMWSVGGGIYPAECPELLAEVWAANCFPDCREKRICR
jgi:hypothetical protein